MRCPAIRRTVAFGRPEEEVPIPALGANVVWILATNGVLAASLSLACR